MLACALRTTRLWLRLGHLSKLQIKVFDLELGEAKHAL